MLYRKRINEGLCIILRIKSCMRWVLVCVDISFYGVNIAVEFFSCLTEMIYI